MQSKWGATTVERLNNLRLGDEFRFFGGFYVVDEHDNGVVWAKIRKNSQNIEPLRVMFSPDTRVLVKGQL